MTLGPLSSSDAIKKLIKIKSVRYSRRWVDKVGHRGMKCLLNIGKIQSIDFAGQIACMSSYIGQNNKLSYVARFESYEPVGGIFTELACETVELSVVNRIRSADRRSINVVAEFISCDPFELTKNIINKNN